MSDTDRAILEALRDTWDANPVEPVSCGDRVFTRWVRLDPDDPGWDDWALTGTVFADRLVPMYDEHPLHAPISEAIGNGQTSGRIEADEFTTVWWVRHVLDGPPERVSDWMKEPS